MHRIIAALAPPEISTPAAAKTETSSATDPVITTLSAAPRSIPEGSGATLCVSARHATQLSLSGIGEVNPLLLDCRHVSPDGHDHVHGLGRECHRGDGLTKRDADRYTLTAGS